jgi:hypothetical protein
VVDRGQEQGRVGAGDVGVVGRVVARVDLPNPFGDSADPLSASRYHQTVESTSSNSSIGLV